MSVQLPINSNSWLTCGFSMFDSMLASGFSFAGKASIVIISVVVVFDSLLSVAVSLNFLFPALVHLILILLGLVVVIRLPVVFLQ